MFCILHRIKRPLCAAVIVGGVLWQAACSSLVHAPLPTYRDTVETEFVLLNDVPFVPQADYQCGPASLDMILGYAELSPGLSNLVDWVYSPERQGSLQPFMVGGVRRAQAVAFEIRGAPALLAELAAGHPVVVFQNLGLSWLPRWHYAVAIGYDLNQSRIFMHSGNQQQMSVDWSRFLSTWTRGGEWGLLALPHGTIPESLDADAVFVAIAATEPVIVSSASLIKSYQAMLTRWPAHLPASLGLANVYYRNGEAICARETLLRAVEFYPNATEVHNNLANLYLEEGRLEDAHHHAKLAVELGGEFLSFARKTLAEIEAQLTSGAQ